MPAKTPNPPYYMVTFVSELNDHAPGYEEMAEKMMKLAEEQEGFLGVDSARSEVGITISYWESMDAIKKWSQNSEHIKAKDLGKKEWYASHITRIAKVEREY